MHGGGEAAARQAPASASLLLQAQVLVDGLGLQVSGQSLLVSREAVTGQFDGWGCRHMHGMRVVYAWCMHGRLLNSGLVAVM